MKASHSWGTGSGPVHRQKHQRCAKWPLSKSILYPEAKCPGNIFFFRSKAVIARSLLRFQDTRNYFCTGTTVTSSFISSRDWIRAAHRGGGWGIGKALSVATQPLHVSIFPCWLRRRLCVNIILKRQWSIKIH